MRYTTPWPAYLFTLLITCSVTASCGSALGDLETSFEGEVVLTLEVDGDIERSIYDEVVYLSQPIEGARTDVLIGWLEGRCLATANLDGDAIIIPEQNCERAFDSVDDFEYEGNGRLMEDGALEFTITGRVRDDNELVDVEYEFEGEPRL